MTFEVRARPEGGRTILLLIGRIGREELEELRCQIESRAPLALDLGEVTLVDRAAVVFLLRAEEGGLVLRCCPPYVREWITREKAFLTGAES